jgi:hypothetical protein
MAVKKLAIWREAWENDAALRKELVIKRPFIWRAGWSMVAMRLFLPSVAVAQVTASSPAGVAGVILSPLG